MNNLPKISIITPSFNQGQFLEQAIRSVIEQDYPNLEYIIIDGGSSDESVEVIKKYEKHLTYWVSEPDRGQSHAINKGFEKATGEIFGWLNSDDWYAPRALHTVAETFAANPEAGAVVGSGEMVDERGKMVHFADAFEVTAEALYNWIDRFFMQPSCFFCRRSWDKCGPLNEQIHFAMDLDLWIKIAKNYPFAVCDAMLSYSLVHSSAKTTAFAADSIIDASLVIYDQGGKDFCRDKLKHYITESRALAVEVDMLIRENHELKRIIQCHEDKIHALENSLSWRITSPLRRLGHSFSIKASNPNFTSPETCHSINLDDIAQMLAGRTNKKPLILLLDFELSGGSSLYSRNLIVSLERAGYRVIVLAYGYVRKSYHFEVNPGKGVIEKVFTSDISDFFGDIVTKMAVDFIVVNQLVSWPKTAGIMGLIKDSSLPYFVLVHDYFMVCPNFTLFDYRDNFCGIPDDPATCANCLEKKRDIDIPFDHHTPTKRIEPWRREGELFLEGADKVICFSDSSLELVKKAYPRLDNLLVNGHGIPDVHHFNWAQRSYNSGELLTVAVVGVISVAKGSKFLDELINSIEFKKLRIRVVLIGDVTPPPRRFGLDNAKFLIHGSYNRANLGKLLEQYDVSLVIIPSQCPETFCFTASEAILLGYPVICFDLGAQAERVQGYGCGWVAEKPYVKSTIELLKGILANPVVVKEKSLLTRNYLPQTVEQHFSVVREVVSAKINK